MISKENGERKDAGLSRTACVFCCVDYWYVVVCKMF